MDGSLQHAVSQPGKTDDILFRQLTHQTKNSMQRIMNELARSHALSASPEWKRLVSDLQQRVLMSARLPDLLFGAFSETETLRSRLISMSEMVIALLGDADQVIDLHVSVMDAVPVRLQPMLLRVAHEMIGNAVKHGMRARIVGRIWVDVSFDDELTLCVKNDGWALCPDYEPGEGMALMRQLAEAIGGRLSVSREQEITSVTMVAHHG